MKHAPFLKLLSGAALALALVSSPAIARDRHGDQASKDSKQALYPNATRKEPKLDLTSQSEQKKLNAGLEAVNAGDNAKAMELLQPIVQDEDSSKYAQSLALQGIANIKYQGGDTKGAIDALKRSLDIGVMPNDTYFQLEYELAQFYLADEQYQPALDTLSKWRSEGKRETAESYALEGNAYYRLEKYPEAIAAIKKAMSLTDKPQASWNQILMASYAESGQADQAADVAQQQLQANPNDATAMNNAVAVLMQAQKYPQAIELMEKARANGTLKDEKQYVNLAKLYLITGQNSDDPKPGAKKAEAVLEDGMAKGVITSSYENYKLLGDAAYIAGDDSKAIAGYKKAMPLAQDGEAALRAGQLLLNQQKYSDARTLIKQGIAKGVKHQGTAYMMLAEAERALKNKPAAIAAMKKAAQDPDTAAKAKAWLKQAGAK
ncbi:tetratricopeptide repeat protein [Frateuria hangzhouensis]|uniref:tetratricopeptide repeat protein n=1 Tax=Frateuria hangzhouensis TaxID=2995589 RepID=UPI002260E851|nr:tetratricopeptide repeat protein [Frateuria sp. STR12]MCX7513351.1 tetratricopeptide repeat protein [Frateuria sp. STR12]